MDRKDALSDAIAHVCAKVCVPATAMAMFLGLLALLGDGEVHFLLYTLFAGCVIVAAGTALIVIVIRVNGLGVAHAGPTDDGATESEKKPDESYPTNCLSCGESMPVGKRTCDKCGWSYEESEAPE